MVGFLDLPRLVFRRDFTKYYTERDSWFLSEFERSLHPKIT